MRDQAHANKSRFDEVGRYKRPMDVVEATGIPVSEKLSILKAGEEDERARCDEARGRSAVNMHLHRVQEALDRLQSQRRATSG